jgi:uncharacterized secreted protein with C-terminal beta-propeller domain
MGFGLVRTTLGLALALASPTTGCGYLKRNILWEGSPEQGSDPIQRIVDPDLDERLANRGVAPAVVDGVFQLQASLTQSKSCEDAAEGIRTIMLSHMRSQFDTQIHFASMTQQGDSREGAAPVSAEAPPNSKAAATEPQNHTTTNNQVEGVEEGDFVKNTGTVMFVAQQDRIAVVKSWPPEDMAQLASIVLGDLIHEMVLVDNNTLVVASAPKLSQSPRNNAFSSDTTTLTTIEVSNPTNPRITDRQHVHGSFMSIRRVDQSVRLVLRSWIGTPEGVQHHLPYEPNGRPLSAGETAAKLQGLYESNKAILKSLSASELLQGTPTPRAHEGIRYANTPDPLPLFGANSANCSNLYLPSVPPQDQTLTSVVTLDLGNKTINSELILAGASIIYASKDHLFLAGTIWNGWSTLKGTEQEPPAGASSSWTTIHQFDARQADRTRYVASGTVPGNLLNQFSMDEHEGTLRLALTESRYVDVPQTGRWGGWRPTDTVSNITTMKPEGSSLRIIGKTPDLAPGERIFSSRFDGNRGFIVTFRQVDPLFAIDLADPTQPKVLGELKIPGFSDYMQFTDKDTLLTIGRDADPSTGQALGLKLSLFDVSDMTKPMEIHNHIIPNPGWASSEASHDHKAFTYFAHTGHLAIPLSSYNWTPGNYRFDNKLALFSINKDTGIEPSGDMDLADLTPKLSSESINWIPSHLQVKRSLFADDYVYAISSGGIKVASIANPSLATKSLMLPCRVCSEWAAFWPSFGSGPRLFD